MKRLFILGFILLVAACETTPKGPAQTVYAIQGTYTGALQIANAYRDLPICPVQAPVCRTPEVLATVLKADDAAWTAIKNAQDAVRNPLAKGSTTDQAILAAQGAVSTFVSITNQLRTK